VLLEASRVFARSWFACSHPTPALVCGGGEDELFGLHAVAISTAAGTTAASKERRKSLYPVRVRVLTEASFVIDGSRIRSSSIDRGSLGVVRASAQLRFWVAGGLSPR
jgi:hypothetical protein